MKHDLSVALTFDVDGPSAWIGTMESRNPSMVSRGEFTVVATPRVLSLLKKHDIPGTFCIPGHNILAFPDIVRAIRDDGHEFGHHGWVHENPAKFDRANERRIIENGLAAYKKLDIRPVGYRSPAWDFSENTVELLEEFGFLYDSSCMAHDFHPYYLRKHDKWGLDEPYMFGPVTEIIELPVTWGLDDYPAFEVVAGWNQGYSNPRDIEEIWWDDFQYALENCKGGIYTLTMHPEFIGRGHRIMMLDRLIQRMKACEGVHFTTLGAYAAEWKSQNPLAKWKLENPMRTGVNSFSSL